MPPSPNNDPIKHVILLILENRSFDQMLGCFKAVYPELLGVDPNDLKSNADDTGHQFKQESTKETQMEPDPDHTNPRVLVQLQNSNSGFIKSYILAHPESTEVQRQQIMNFYPLMFLPALHRMARDFTICDHWFSSVPGPTWANRFFALSGTSSGRVKMPALKDPELKQFFLQNQDTIFDRLNEAKRSWKIYFYDFACSLIFNKQREPHNLAGYSEIDNFFREVRNEAEFPEFCLIEPKYAGRDENDDHPPHNVMKGEKLIADVYNALRSREELWKSSLLVIYFDEHGGFFDHVVPPPAVPPDKDQVEYTFDQLGVRVPAVLVSPWVDKRVEQTVFDHTSVLKYLIDKWNLGGLGARTAAANSIGTAITRTEPREDTLPFIRVSQTLLTSPHPELEYEDSSEHHAALARFSEFLADELDPVAARALERVARTAGWWMRLKAFVGRKFIGAGAWMASDLQKHDQQRAKMITAVIMARIKGVVIPEG